MAGSGTAKELMPFAALPGHGCNKVNVRIDLQRGVARIAFGVEQVVTIDLPRPQMIEFVGNENDVLSRCMKATEVHDKFPVDEQPKVVIGAGVQGLVARIAKLTMRFQREVVVVIEAFVAQ